MNSTMAARCFVVLVFVSFLVMSVSAIPSKRRRGSFSTIKQLNRKGPFIGLITVYSPEEEAFFRSGAFKPDAKHPFVDLSGRAKVSSGKNQWEESRFREMWGWNDKRCCGNTTNAGSV